MKKMSSSPKNQQQDDIIDLLDDDSNSSRSDGGGCRRRRGEDDNVLKNGFDDGNNSSGQQWATNATPATTNSSSWNSTHIDNSATASSSSNINSNDNKKTKNKERKHERMNLPAESKSTTISLLDSDDSDDDNADSERMKPTKKRRREGVDEDDLPRSNKAHSKKKPPPMSLPPPRRSSSSYSSSMRTNRTIKRLQAGLVLEEDIFSCIRNHINGNDDNGENVVSLFVKEQNERVRRGLQPFLFEDHEFPPVPSSIQGIHEKSVLDYLLRHSNDESRNENNNNGFLLSSSTTTTNKKNINGRKSVNDDVITNYFPKCRCKRPCQLSYKRGSHKSSGRMNRPYFHCANPNQKCQWFSWAFMAELTPWYRFGTHNNHQLLVLPRTQQEESILLQTNTQSVVSSSSSFSAQDLVQGKVGDCWFLSALAVIAERPDLIQRLFQREGNSDGSVMNVRRSELGRTILDDWYQDDKFGIVQVNLFVDGWWTQITMDNFLPCMVGQVDQKEDDELKRAIEESLKDHGVTRKHDDKNSNNITNKYSDGRDRDTEKMQNPYTKSTTMRNPYAKTASQPKTSSSSPFSTLDGHRLKEEKTVATKNDGLDGSSSSSRPVDPFAMSSKTVRSLKVVCDYLDDERRGRFGISNTTSNTSSGYNCYVLDRPAESQDLAYSKGRRNQLWIPFVEKAYCKAYGSYKAISGGHIAEAFLDLTGAPTLQIQWHQNNAHMNSCIMEPKPLWSKLVQYRAQKLPMGCGTDNSAGGIIGMHAYSILDVREIHNVGLEFFEDQLIRGTLGNVSGFTEYDGIVRLLRIRNPHGKGEWKGQFSDKCNAWERLLVSSGVTLPRTNADDGTFWIGYDDFLMGFSNIDVVLAFEGNHAKSFASNFPEKKSNHRCTRAFEVSLLDDQSGIVTKDQVELYVMTIQKSRRGASRGRSDRKKSYKVSDLGLVVGEYALDDEEKINYVHGQMFGFRRNGHYRLLLDRRRCRRMVVLPISFGHPAATDKELSYVVRFNANAPLMIRELPDVPRMDILLQRYLLGAKPFTHFLETRQGQQKVLFEKQGFRVVQINCLGNEGGTVFVYLCADDSARRNSSHDSISLVVTATCRGMSCRVDGNLLEHETIAKGKKFEASWRRFTADLVDMNQSRLLMVLYQSGQDTEMGIVTCQEAHRLGIDSSSNTDKKCPAPKMKSATLDQFWQKSSVDQSSPADKNVEYVDSGIFCHTSMDPHLFQSCGQNSGTALVGYGVDGDEPDEILRVLETSREQNELEKAIEASLESARGDEGDSGSMRFGSNSVAAAYDPELQEALKRSLLDSKKTCENKKDVIVLDDNDDGPKGTFDRRDYRKAAPGSSRNKFPSSTGGPDILDLTSDNEDEKEGDGPRSDPASVGTESQPVDRETKRRQLAEAAQKRFETLKPNPKTLDA